MYLAEVGSKFQFNNGLSCGQLSTQMKSVYTYVLTIILEPSCVNARRFSAPKKTSQSQCRKVNSTTGFLCLEHSNLVCITEGKLKLKIAKCQSFEKIKKTNLFKSFPADFSSLGSFQIAFCFLLKILALEYAFEMFTSMPTHRLSIHCAPVRALKREEPFDNS